MIVENENLVNRFISVPKELGLNCSAFVAGIVEGMLGTLQAISKMWFYFIFFLIFVLDAAEFGATVSAHFGENPGKSTLRNVLVIKLDKAVMQREQGVL